MGNEIKGTTITGRNYKTFEFVSDLKGRMLKGMLQEIPARGEMLPHRVFIAHNFYDPHKGADAW